MRDELPSVRTFGLGYVVFQLYWLLVRRSPSPEWAVWQVSALVGGMGALAMGLATVYPTGGRPLRLSVGIVLATIVAAELGMGIGILVGGGFALVGLVGGWAAAFALMVRPSTPAWATWTLLLVGAAFGVVAIPLIYRWLGEFFEYETYGLTHAMVIPMLLAGAYTCRKLVTSAGLTGDR